jgi:uncharacterized protein YaiL (DUF2058 family)|tara:strand:+ start:85 stop:270 length:186 start_codon:yes stop_codon:yes gene_type:complete
MNNDLTISNNKDIFNFLNINEIKKLLIHNPQLSILFEMLCLHINNIIQSDSKYYLSKSSPI